MILLLLACAAEPLDSSADSSCLGQRVHGQVLHWDTPWTGAIVVVRTNGEDAYQVSLDAEARYSTQVPAGVDIGLMVQDEQGCQSPEETVVLEPCEELELDLVMPEDCGGVG